MAAFVRLLGVGTLVGGRWHGEPGFLEKSEVGRVNLPKLTLESEIVTMVIFFFVCFFFPWLQHADLGLFAPFCFHCGVHSCPGVDIPSLENLVLIFPLSALALPTYQLASLFPPAITITCSDPLR
jgi:hypothetical protein